ncbi:MAG: GIY-YIG nuclease family protein [Candidatus Kapabacteria bacterium]|jgi:putative endonuclease|nr:GIY-YIG nuclease family protein [Candidatus Kapabacteria bacterium]
MNTYFVYILANSKYGTLYIGATNNLPRRMYEHSHGLIEGFTQKYSVHQLVWYESTVNAFSMATRERQMKEWKREWKINLINTHNPEWQNLYQHGEILPLPIP